jgi:hypothetical protein
METNPHANAICKACSTPLIRGDNWSIGLQNSRTRLCRSCNAAKGRAFYAANKKHVIETAKARRHREPDKIKAYWRGWRDRSKDQIKEYEERYRVSTYTSAERRAMRLATACRLRAKKAGVDYDLTKEWVLAKLASGHCEVTGLPFDMATLAPRGERKSRTPAFAPSLDRIQQGGGYTQDNTRVVVFIYNVARADFDDSDLTTLAKALLDGA